MWIFWIGGIKIKKVNFYIEGVNQWEKVCVLCIRDVPADITPTPKETAIALPPKFKGISLKSLVPYWTE